MRFKRDIGAFGLLFTGIGSIVGSGWLFGPFYAAQIAGPAAIISWIIGGLLMAIIILTFAELGSSFPAAGGMVQYAQYSHGPLVSFITGWMVWISSIAIAPVETLGLIQYAANYIPGLVIKVANTTVLTRQGIGIGAIIMFIMCFLNYQGAKFFSRSNSIITVIKLIVPTLTFLALLLIDFHSHNFNSPQVGGFAPYGWKGIVAALPLGGVIYSFMGSNTILQLAGETKNPQKNIPLALIVSMIFCIILYVLLQVAFIGALMPESIVKGWKNIYYPGDSGPFAGILTSLGIGWFVIVVYADALISPFGTGYIYTATAARVNYGLSRIGFFPKLFQKLTDKGVPLRAIIMNYCFGLLLFLPFPGWQGMVSFIISSITISYVIGPIALIGLRKTHPQQPRPFRLPGATLFCLAAFYICNLLIFWTGWHTVHHTLIAMGIGFIFFVVHCVQEKNNVWIQQWRTSWWMIPYLVGMGIISYLGTFGSGLGIITFGMDFLLLGLLTLIIFFLAVSFTQKTNLIWNAE